MSISSSESGSLECPTADDIACFVEGYATSATSERILNHVDTCGRCLVLLANAVRATDMSSVEAPKRETRTFVNDMIVGDRYRIERFISQGGMGEVYAAWDCELGETVALKTLACTSLDNSKLLSRIRAEVQLARRVTHPNVCRILEFGQHQHIERGTPEAIPFFTMQLVDGVTLAAYAARRGRLGGRELVSIALQILDALSAIHGAGIIHRDLKPENVFITKGVRGELHVIVVDFGLARPIDAKNPWISSHEGDAVGTPAYMAPEQVLGEAPSTAWDVYSFGVLLFSLVSGELPFKGNTAIATAMARVNGVAPSLSSILPEIDSTLEAVVARCLERDPNRRFAGVGAIRDALANVSETTPHRSAFRRAVPVLILALCVSVFVRWLYVFSDRRVSDRANAAGSMQAEQAAIASEASSPSDCDGSAAHSRTNQNSTDNRGTTKSGLTQRVDAEHLEFIIAPARIKESPSKYDYARPKVAGAANRSATYGTLPDRSLQTAGIGAASSKNLRRKPSAAVPAGSATEGTRSKPPEDDNVAGY